MNHGISFVAVNNEPLQQAIADGASTDRISSLKQRIAYEATIGYQYDEVSFTDLSAILSNDYAFNPFKFKSVEEGATYNAVAYPKPHGRIRGRDNVTGKCSWVCLDIDDTTVSNTEYHSILANINHHIARTSDSDNPYKYRVILPLSYPVDIDNNHWKFFIDSIAKYLHCKVDRLPRSQLLIGYKDRQVYTTIGKQSIDPSTHLKWAQMKVAELEEKNATALPPAERSAKLDKPYSTFTRGYEAPSGEGTTMLLSCIYEAKQLGATREYIEDLVYSINAFWTRSMPIHRLQATVMTAI